MATLYYIYKRLCAADFRHVDDIGGKLLCTKRCTENMSVTCQFCCNLLAWPGSMKQNNHDHWEEHVHVPLLAQGIPSLACSQVFCLDATKKSCFLMAKSRAWSQIQTLIARQVVFDPTRWGRSLDELSATYRLWEKGRSEISPRKFLDAMQGFRMEYVYTIIVCVYIYIYVYNIAW